MNAIEYGEALRDIVSVLDAAARAARHDWLRRDLEAKVPDRRPHIADYLAEADQFGVCEGMRLEVDGENGVKMTFVYTHDRTDQNEKYVITPDDTDGTAQREAVRLVNKDGMYSLEEMNSDVSGSDEGRIVGRDFLNVKVVTR